MKQHECARLCKSKETKVESKVTTVKKRKEQVKEKKEKVHRGGREQSGASLIVFLMAALTDQLADAN